MTTDTHNPNPAQADPADVAGPQISAGRRRFGRFVMAAGGLMIVAAFCGANGAFGGWGFCTIILGMLITFGTGGDVRPSDGLSVPLVNPSTGLTMINGIGGVDGSGTPYGGKPPR